ncbi:4-hydroxy-2-oxovalerate aldolase (plasmid) [Rhodococcus ruber]
MFTAVADLQTGSRGRELFGRQATTYHLIRLLQHRPLRLDREALTRGYTGAYSSFLRHAEAAFERYGIDGRTILRNVGRHALVGEQEVLIVDIVLEPESTGREG